MPRCDWKCSPARAFAPVPAAVPPDWRDERRLQSSTSPRNAREQPTVIPHERTDRTTIERKLAAHGGAAVRPVARGVVPVLRRCGQSGSNHAAPTALPHPDAAADRDGVGHAHRLPAPAARRADSLAHPHRGLGTAPPLRRRTDPRTVPPVASRAYVRGTGRPDRHDGLGGLPIHRRTAGASPVHRPRSRVDLRVPHEGPRGTLRDDRFIGPAHHPSARPTGRA
jgi:hypothetical protein